MLCYQCLHSFGWLWYDKWPYGKKINISISGEGGVCYLVYVLSTNKLFLLSFIGVLSWNALSRAWEFCQGECIHSHRNCRHSRHLWLSARVRNYCFCIGLITSIVCARLHLHTFIHFNRHRGLGNNSQSVRPVVYLTYSSSASGKEFKDSGKRLLCLIFYLFYIIAY